RFAPVRLRSASRRTGSSGRLLRVSITANAVSSTTDAASEATTLASPQWETPSGLVAALTRPYTRATIPPVPVIAPGRSNRPRWRGDSGSPRDAASAAVTPIGTLTNSTHRQDAYVVSRPPAISPTAPPATLIAAYTPIARFRGRPPGKVVA